MIQILNKDEENIYINIVRNKINKRQLTKARRFLRHKCIWQLEDNSFICKNIEGYNTKTYELRKDKFRQWTCNCQFFRKNNFDMVCSHLIALYIYLAQLRDNIREKNKGLIVSRDEVI